MLNCVMPQGGPQAKWLEELKAGVAELVAGSVEAEAVEDCQLSGQEQLVRRWATASVTL